MSLESTEINANRKTTNYLILPYPVAHVLPLGLCVCTVDHFGFLHTRLMKWWS